MARPGDQSVSAQVLGVAEESVCAEDARLSGRSAAAVYDPPSAQDDASASVDAVLESIGFGRFQLTVMAICGVAWFVDSVEVSGLPYVYVALDAAWGTTAARWGVLQSAKSACSVAGALLFGAAADRHGRRPALLASLALTALGGLASAASRGYRSLLLLRAATNLGAGGVLPVAISLLSEHLPPSAREPGMVLMQVFFVAGHVAAVAVSMALPSAGEAWRAFLAVLALPAALLLLAWRAVPESPAYLQLSGDEAGARRALEAMARANGRDPGRAVLPARLRPCGAPADARATGFAYLFGSRDTAGRIAAFGSLWALTMAASDFNGWITELGHARGFEKRSVEGFVIVCKVVGVGAFLAAAACARGRRGRLILCLGYMGASTAAAAAAIADSMGASRLWLPFFAALLYFPFDVVWSLLYAVTAAEFEPACRASALSACSACSRAAATAVPLVTGALLARGGARALQLWSSAWCAAACLACAVLCRRPGREAREGGRTLPPCASSS